MYERVKMKRAGRCRSLGYTVLVRVLHTRILNGQCSTCRHRDNSGGPARSGVLTHGDEHNAVLDLITDLACSWDTRNDRDVGDMAAVEAIEVVRTAADRADAVFHRFELDVVAWSARC